MILFRRRGEVRGRRLVMVNFAWLAGREIISSALRCRLGIFVLGVFWCVLGYCRFVRVDGDLFVDLRLGRDLLALVVVDLVSLGLNRSNKRFVTFVQ